MTINKIVRNVKEGLEGFLVISSLIMTFGGGIWIGSLVGEEIARHKIKNERLDELQNVLESSPRIKAYFELHNQSPFEYLTGVKYSEEEKHTINDYRLYGMLLGIPGGFITGQLIGYPIWRKKK